MFYLKFFVIYVTSSIIILFIYFHFNEKNIILMSLLYLLYLDNNGGWSLNATLGRIDRIAVSYIKYGINVRNWLNYFLSNERLSTISVASIL